MGHVDDFHNLGNSRIPQAVENICHSRRNRDDEVRPVLRIGDVKPEVRVGQAHAIGLRYPAQMILRPRQVDRVPVDANGDVRWIGRQDICCHRQCRCV